jgi:hypothetical protein
MQLWEQLTVSSEFLIRSHLFRTSTVKIIHIVSVVRQNNLPLLTVYSTHKTNKYNISANSPSTMTGKSKAVLKNIFMKV